MVEVAHLDAFAAAPGGGNPCPVVVATAGLSDRDMQALAAHFRHETGFVVRDPDGGLRLRYFVPRHEMAMCVHASVAAVTLLAGSGALAGGEATARTASGDCRVSWTDETPTQVTVEQQPPRFGAPQDLAVELERAAGLPAGAVDDRMPVRSVSVSRAKLIVPLRSVSDLDSAEPDFPALWELCRRTETTGAYLYAPGELAGRVSARQFPVDAGYPEDAATGVAAGALAAYLAAQSASAAAGGTSAAGWHGVVVDQGVAMGRPSRLRASAYLDSDGAVRRSTVTGTAVVRSRETVDVRAIAAAYDGVVPGLR